MKKRGHFIISGRVQGVCFRIYTLEEARRLGVTGWVRNLRDGTVEVMAEGDEKALVDLEMWCRQGPSYAHVTDIQVTYTDAADEFDEFGITY